MNAHRKDGPAHCTRDCGTKKAVMSIHAVTRSDHSTPGVSVRGCFLGCGLLSPQSQILSEQGGSSQVEHSPRTLAQCRASYMLSEMFLLILVPWPVALQNRVALLKISKQSPGLCQTPAPPTLSCPTLSYIKLS